MDNIHIKKEGEKYTVGTIKELDYNTVVQIAAGEVIDRPASLVRELIDNSIDAGATIISVHIADGGKSYIEVKDNGCGMDADDLAICYKNHTTSKINNFDEISKVSTLGFRGEALSSIAEVARLTVLSRQQTAIAGNKLEVEFGKLIELNETGINIGTTVIIKGLFEKLPAREKFLGHASTETRHIDKEIIKKAIAFPQIAFEFVVNGKQKYHSSAKNTYLERIVDFFPDTLEYLIPIEFISPDLKLSGFISKPAFIRSNRMYQYFFVNNRAVEWKSFYYATSNVYGNLVPKGHFPAIFLYVDINPQQIDVNVHPMKREVRFTNEYKLSKQIQYTMKEALFADDGISEVDSSTMQFTPYEKKIAGAITDYVSAHEQQDSEVSLEFKDSVKFILGSPENTHPISAKNLPALQELLSYRLVGIAFLTYIILEGPERVVFIDQHAAHERINYEKLRTKYKTKDIGSQELLIPVNVDVPTEIVDGLKNSLQTLAAMGFDVEHFGGSTFVIRSIPQYINYENSAEVVMGFVETIEENKTGDIHSSDFIDSAIKQMACKGSIRAGDKINSSEVFALLEELLATERPFSCPHGRPVMFSLSKHDIEKQFKRLGF